MNITKFLLPLREKKMKESIIIRNFGPIKEIAIDDIRPFTVFIGESGLSPGDTLIVSGIMQLQDGLPMVIN